MILKTCADKTGDIVTVSCPLPLITIISSFTVVLFGKCVCVCRGGGGSNTFISTQFFLLGIHERIARRLPSAFF